MKKLSIIAAVFAVLAMASVSFAANTASINVTSEPIGQGSTCGKAGGFTLTFDEGTVFTVGDKITFDLDLNTTLCKNVSIEIGTWVATGSVSGIGSAADLTDPNGAAVESSAGVVAAAGGDLSFRIIGNAGTQRVTLSVVGDAGATLTVTDDNVASTQNTLKLSFLNSTDYSSTGLNAGAGDVVVTKYTAATTSDPAEWALANETSNTLCINVSETTATTVNANFDSANDTYTFVPSNPQVSHIAAAATYTVYSPKNMEPGNIILAGTGDQETCSVIDNTTGTGFCSTGNVHADNDFIFYSDSEFDLEGQIQITLEILVNGTSGANGVYFSSSTVYTHYAETTTGTYTANAGVAGSVYASDGETTKTLDGDTSDCEVEEDDQGVMIVAEATASSLGLDATNKAFKIDIPQMTYDSSVVSEDDVVTVKVSVENLPCGNIIDGETMEIGTFGCVSATTSTSLRYPYFGTATGSYANAIVITNIDSDDGTADLTLYEADGDIATATVSISAHSMYVNLVSNIDWTISASSTGSGTLGDARAYIDLDADVNVDGTAMITNASTGESISYLPRQ